MTTQAAGGLQNAVNALDPEALIKAQTAHGSMDGTDDDDDDDDEDELGKSLVADTDDLLKSLDALTATSTAVESGVSLRQTKLAAKAAAGDELSKSERGELVAFLSDDPEDGDALVKSHADAFVENPTVAQGMDVSDFLEEQTMVLAKSLDSIHGDVRMHGQEQATFNGILAKSLSAIGRVVAGQAAEIATLKKSLITNAAVAGQAPMLPKGVSRIGQPFGEALVKSQLPAGTPGAIPQAQPGENPLVALGDDHAIMGTMEDLIKSSFDKNEGGIVSGVDMNFELTKFESTRMLSGPALHLVAQARNVDPAAIQQYAE